MIQGLILGCSPHTGIALLSSVGQRKEQAEAFFPRLGKKNPQL